MKKGMLLSVLLLMVVVLISCSSGAKQVPEEKAVSQPAAAEAAESTPEVDTIEELEQASGTEINVSMGKTGENMSLPESFPKEVFPLTEDANIINVNDNKDSKSLSIIFKTGKSFDEAVAFYKDIMKGGSITAETQNDVSYLLMGSKDKYSIMITVTKYDGENISILLGVTSL